jgi:hypothetical protein
MKIRPVGAELFHVDGRTDEQTGMAKLIVASCNLRTRLQTSGAVDPVHAMKTYGEAGVQLHILLVSLLHGSVQSASCPGHIILGKNPRHLLDGVLGGPQSCSVFCEQEKNLVLGRNRTLIPLSFRP